MFVPRGFKMNRIPVELRIADKIFWDRRDVQHGVDVVPSNVFRRPCIGILLKKYLFNDGVVIGVLIGMSKCAAGNFIKVAAKFGDKIPITGNCRALFSARSQLLS